MKVVAVAFGKGHLEKKVHRALEDKRVSRGPGQECPSLCPRKDSAKEINIVRCFLLPSLLQLGFLSKSTPGTQHSTVFDAVQKSVISKYQTKLKTR